MTDAVRSKLTALIARDGVTLTAVSRALGRNAAWMQQFLERGTPKSLPEGDRRKLAVFFEVDERELGARDPWSPGNRKASLDDGAERVEASRMPHPRDMSDEDLIAAFERTEGEGEIAEQLLAEIKQRGLDL